MAPMPPAASPNGTRGGTRSWPLFGAVLALFFTWGLATVLVDIITPKLKSLFALSYAEATLTQFCFFVAYALVSLPAGSLIGRIGYMRGLVVGLIVTACGCLGFAPAAWMGLYPVFLFALFVMASGIAVLQVAANPLMTKLGPPEQASSRLTLAQTFNSFGTTIGPAIGAWAILGHGSETGNAGSLSPEALAAARHDEAAVLQGPFLTIAVVLAALALFFWVSRRALSNETATASRGLGLDLLRQPNLAFGAAALFLYVGAEVAIGTLMVSYLEQPTTLGASPERAGHLLGLYWGGAFAGRLLGAVVLRHVRPGLALGTCALCAGALTTASGLSTGAASAASLLAVGLANAIMFPTIFAMAIEGLGARTAQGSGIVCVAIVGGAIVPVITGLLADSIGLHGALGVPVLCYVCIAAYALSRVRQARAQPPAGLAA